MQLIVISGTCFALLSLSFLLFKYTAVSHEIVQIYYEQHKKLLYEQSRLLYGVGIFLEEARLQSPSMPINLIVDHDEYIFIPHDNTIRVSVKGITTSCILSSIKKETKKSPVLWKATFITP